MKIEYSSLKSGFIRDWFLEREMYNKKMCYICKCSVLLNYIEFQWQKFIGGYTHIVKYIKIQDTSYNIFQHDNIHLESQNCWNIHKIVTNGLEILALSQGYKFLGFTSSRSSE